VIHRYEEKKMIERKGLINNRQQGISLTGLILVLMVLGLFALLAIKVVPSYVEYRAVRDGVVRAKAAGGGAVEMQRTFDKFAEINNVSAIRGRDLVISRDGETPEISFAYEKRIPLTGHATLVIDYDGTTSPGGVVATKPD
jgi:type II secretory pathway pseudopilin PulG